MRKYLITLVIAIALPVVALAQVSLSDFGRIILNSYLPTGLPINYEARNLLETKLKEIATINGMGGSDFNPRFIITANINIGTKDIIAGAPTKVSQKINLTLFIGDAISNTIFSSTTLSLIGVGVNENKSFIEAFNLINPRNKSIKEMIDEGKNKIVAYYLAQCDFISKDVETLIGKQQYEEAIYTLALVPQVCKDCYLQSQDKMQTVFKMKINYDGASLLSKAKTIWMAQPNSTGAEQVRLPINAINPSADCYSEVAPFIETIRKKVLADEKQQWQFEMKQYNDNLESEKKEYADNVELERSRIDACRQIAVEYARNQPKTISYSYIIW